MALTQRLQIRQSQALVMTPQLMQAIKLLQLSNLDLSAYVEAELERNPLLDRGSEEEPAASAADGPAADAPPADGEPWDGSTIEPSGDNVDDRLGGNLDDGSADDAEPSRPRTLEAPPGYSEWAGVGSGGRDGGDYNLEAFVSAETTLADWLREQLVLAVADPAQRDQGVHADGGIRFLFQRFQQRRHRHFGVGANLRKGVDAGSAEAGMAEMAQKFRDMGGEVYIEAEAVKASNRAL